VIEFTGYEIPPTFVFNQGKWDSFLCE